MVQGTALLHFRLVWGLVILLARFSYSFVVPVPVYPSLHHTTQTCPYLNIHDRLWNQQWYLHRDSRIQGHYYDMNVIPAWQKCYNGSGITVAVLDTGIQDHPDLNIDRSIHFSVPYTQQNPPRKHGTNVAGIIAAKKNALGGIGIAYGATIADFQLLTRNQQQQDIARALDYATDKIDIYSCSFADFETGFTTYPLDPGVKASLEYGTKMGRHGKGSVYVVSSGNGGAFFYADSCAYSGFMNNRYVIPVAGIQYNLDRVSTGENCSSIFVAAFTKEPDDNNSPIVTTGPDNSYTKTFARTSAAVPMVSGAIALALQANPSLSYRDVMHLLALTAKTDFQYTSFRNDHFRSTFQCNGAGYLVSHSYGFGLLDIGDLVTMAQSWTPVEPLTICENIEVHNVIMHNHDSLPITIQPSGCQIRYLEHVEIELLYNSNTAGHDVVKLRSPSNTESVLLQGRALDRKKTMNITVVSVFFWGESPQGTWMLTSSAKQSHWTSIKIRFYGTENNTRRRSSPCSNDTYEEFSDNPTDKYGTSSSNRIPVLSLILLLIVTIVLL